MIKKFRGTLQHADNKVLLSNFLSLATLQGANYILPLITLPYLVRVLGIEYFGLLAFATAMIGYFNVITDYGFMLSATREISIHRDNKDKVIEIFSNVMIIKTILLLSTFLLMTLIVFSFEKFSKDWFVYYLTFGMVIGQTLFPVWFFQGMEKMKYITYLNILSKTIFTSTIFIFVQEPNDYYLVPLLSSIGLITAGIYSLFSIHNHFDIKFRFQNVLTIKRYFKEGWSIFLVDFLPNFYNNFSTFFLGFFVSLEIVGFYSLAAKLIDVLNNFIFVIRNATYPYLVKHKSKISKISKITILVGFIFTLGIITVSHIFVPFVFGEKMLNSLKYLYIMSLGPLLISITISYGTNRLLIYKQDKVMKNITMQFSSFGFLLALFLIPTYGAIGSAVTMVVTRLLMAILTYRKGKLL